MNEYRGPSESASHSLPWLPWVLPSLSMDLPTGMEPVAPVEDWDIDPSTLQVGDLIGAGSFGQVYKAKYCGIDVAVKKIIQGVEQAQEFEHEVAVLKYVKACTDRFARLEQENDSRRTLLIALAGLHN